MAVKVRREPGTDERHQRLVDERRQLVEDNAGGEQALETVGKAIDERPVDREAPVKEVGEAKRASKPGELGGNGLVAGLAAAARAVGQSRQVLKDLLNDPPGNGTGVEVLHDDLAL